MLQFDGPAGPVRLHYELSSQSAGVVAWIAVAVLLTLGWVVFRALLRRGIRVHGSQPPWLEKDLALLRRTLTWFVLAQLGLQALAIFLLASGPGLPGGVVMVAGFLSMLLGLVAVAWLAEQIPRRSMDRRLAARQQEVIPVCMHCRLARDAHLAPESLQFGGRRWRPLDDLLSERGMVRFSHSICPECVEDADREQQALPADYDIVGEVDVEGVAEDSGHGGAEPEKAAGGA